MKTTGRLTKSLLLGAMVIGLAPTLSHAQYFQSAPGNVERMVLKSSKYDSVIMNRVTPFKLPATNDTIQFMYHEPMPDSIMPRSAIVIGTITLQFEDVEDLTPALEKYARKAGADWIVSFSEPRAVLTKDHWKVYRSTATLLHVLDPQFIQQSDIAYSYYEKNKLQNFAALTQWYDIYGRQMGVKLDQPEPVKPSEQDEENPDRIKN